MTLSKNDVETVIRLRLDPLFSLDGGAVSVVDVDASRGEIVIAFGGSYQACPGRAVLVECVIEPTLRAELPGVQRVRMS
ncbi:MAG TPA: NifU family protein [Polyangia bacterium]|nr:NifU family protein [Polyangia bacterium]